MTIAKNKIENLHAGLPSEDDQQVDNRLPYDIQIEQYILGCIMNNNAAIDKLRELTAEDFYEGYHGRLFLKMQEIINTGAVANPVTLKNYFQNDAAFEELQGANYLFKLCSMASGIINIREFGIDLKEIHRRRIFAEYIRKYSNIRLDLSFDVDEIMAEMAEKLNERRSFVQFKKESEVCLDVYYDLTTDLPCYSTGLVDLDKAMLGGMFAGKGYCFAARSKMGKSNLLATLSHNMSKANVKHLYIAAEMDSNEIMQRLISHDLGCSASVFYDQQERSYSDFQQKVADYAVQNKGTTIFLDAPSVNFDVMCNLIISAVKRYGIKGVFIDYIQIITGKGKGENSVEFIDRKAQKLHELVKKYKIFLCYAAQKNREGDLRGGDGIQNGVDQLWHIEGSQNAQAGRDDYLRYLTLSHTRYTPKTQLGNAMNPRFKIVNGAAFVEHWSEQTLFKKDEE